eukprot:4129297-Prymnesium_polylepis.1
MPSASSSSSPLDDEFSAACSVPSPGGTRCVPSGCENGDAGSSGVSSVGATGGGGGSPIRACSSSEKSPGPGQSIT